jgi:hypothetical protein
VVVGEYAGERREKEVGLRVLKDESGARCTGSVAREKEQRQRGIGQEGRRRCSPVPLSMRWRDARVGSDQERETETRRDCQQIARRNDATWRRRGSARVRLGLVKGRFSEMVVCSGYSC